MRILILIMFICTLSFAQENFDGGGVDVGNFETENIPGANLRLNIPPSWSHIINNNQLNLYSTENTVINASRMNFGNEQISNQNDLINYLKKNSTKKFDKTFISGMRSLRFESSDRLLQEIYIISPTNEIAKITAKIKLKNLEMADAVLKTIFFKFKGKAYKNSQDHVMKIIPETYDSEHIESEFSFRDACYIDECDDQPVGTQIYYGEDDDIFNLEIGLAGSDSGKIIDLGLNESDYDQIAIKGEYLTLPDTNVKLEKIYE